MNFARQCLRRSQQKCYRLNAKYYPASVKTPLEIWRQIIEERLTRTHGFVLNSGCGKGRDEIDYLSLSTRSIGIDLDAASLRVNKAFNDLVHGDLGFLPFKDSSFDMIVCRDVLEHLQEPTRVFNEFARVLKTDGVIVLLTPNSLNYVSLISRLTPFAFHTYFNTLRGIETTDTFPTYYRANSSRTLNRLAAAAGLRQERLIMVQKWPSYLTFSVWLYRVGVLIERFLTRYQRAAFLRSAIIAEYSKSAPPMG